MPNAVYNSFKRDIMNGSIDLDTDDIYVLLVTSAYTPDIDAHEKRSDITNEVANGNGYTTGGQALTTKAVTENDTDDKGYFDADNSVWSSSTITARGAVLYKSRGGAATADELIGYVDFGQDYSSTSGDFTINWATAGILELA